jgi:hypothetical protein
VLEHRPSRPVWSYFSCICIPPEIRANGRCIFKKVSRKFGLFRGQVRVTTRANSKIARNDKGDVLHSIRLPVTSRQVQRLAYNAEIPKSEFNLVSTRRWPSIFAISEATEYATTRSSLVLPQVQIDTGVTWTRIGNHAPYGLHRHRCDVASDRHAAATATKTRTIRSDAGTRRTRLQSSLPYQPSRHHNRQCARRTGMHGTHASCRSMRARCCNTGRRTAARQERDALRVIPPQTWLPPPLLRHPHMRAPQSCVGRQRLHPLLSLLPL